MGGTSVLVVVIHGLPLLLTLGLLLLLILLVVALDLAGSPLGLGLANGPLHWIHHGHPHHAESILTVRSNLDHMSKPIHHVPTWKTVASVTGRWLAVYHGWDPRIIESRLAEAHFLSVVHEVERVAGNLGVLSLGRGPDHLTMDERLGVVRRDTGGPQRCVSKV